MSEPQSRSIAIVAARWHADIVDQAVDAFKSELESQGYSDVQVFTVPGSFEIPLHVQRLASTGRYAAIAACGLVVDGGIYRHDFVATAVIDALMRIQLETDVPVFSAVLTPHHFHEHTEHVDYFRRHFTKKGEELARACASTVASLASL
ncbi:6,7-dimethyl-8-ribityllumazine synthase [Antrihabitans spumae]|jgi:6,7-dimethyl-8-ribityllumazine synthase|uniref:6,7-dimethyl-8-ribityllumazine synthase n=1 Tax=Antrihabitans spumae TaxID=3373370 RepID=A0ABW7JZ27_9NOCA